MHRFQLSLQALTQARHLIAVGRSHGDLARIADLVDSFLDTPQMEACIHRFRALPGGAAMLEERYPPLQPDLPRLEAMPEESLGHRYAALIRRFNYDPAFFRPRPVDTEGRWLTQRIATTHDIHHVVSGFGTAPAGESGVLAITATQIGFPAYVSLTHAAQIAGFRSHPDGYETLSRAISHGTAIGFTAHAFATVRWEEGWDLPVAEWRRRLGVSLPADDAPYGANAS